jgi:hypothetical protein
LIAEVGWPLMRIEAGKVGISATDVAAPPTRYGLIVEAVILRSPWRSPAVPASARSVPR